MFGIHKTEAFPGRAMIIMGSYGAFCRNAVPTVLVTDTQPYGVQTGTYPRLWTGTGTCAVDVGAGPQVAVGMPAGA
jgi:hypothetical protein